MKREKERERGDFIVRMSLLERTVLTHVPDCLLLGICLEGVTFNWFMLQINVKEGFSVQALDVSSKTVRRCQNMC